MGLVGGLVVLVFLTGDHSRWSRVRNFVDPKGSGQHNLSKFLLLP